ncbi:phage gp36-like protein [Hamadaea flava]|uniref:Uncharacterized protein n=1 Tax=Hamadaea flava TaxID=1742688 RepID=A0ABV8LVM8_9ACTN|nr:hypothetical protein [Hamadaea flava]MCP2327596.1 phage gp36-like protein [Hamadaea flava]
MADGAQLALEDIAAVLIDTLGAGRQPHDTAKPVDVLIRYCDQLAAREGRGWVA